MWCPGPTATTTFDTESLGAEPSRGWRGAPRRGFENRAPIGDKPAMKPSFAHFDQRIADAMMRANDAVTGLPKYLGIRFVEFTPGNLVAEMEARPELLTPMGSLHGGVMAGLVDHCLGCVLYPLMKRGQWAATTEFKLNYLSAVKQGKLVARSTVIAFTSRTAVVQVEVTNDDRLACIAQGTLLIVDPSAKTSG